MSDWKLVLGVVLGSVLLLVVVIFGLSRLSGSTSALKVDQQVLLDGAKLVKENGETKVTVVIFSDMECPGCKQAHEETAGLMNKPGVKMVYRYFPLPPQIHKDALISARAVETARLMGKGWEMVDVVFNKQREWSGSDNVLEKLTTYAVGLGLDSKKFTETINSTEVAKNVKVDADLASSLRLPGTPTIFINGEQVGAGFVVAKVEELLANK